MNDLDHFHAVAQRQLQKARAAGDCTPVLAILPPHRRPARAAFADRHGGRLKPGGRDWVRGLGRIVAWSLADAVRLLRRHAGLGGNLVANLLDGPPRAVDRWMLDWGPVLAVAGLRDEEPVLTSCALYDDLPFAVCDCCAAKYGAGDRHAPLGGDDRAAALLGIVASRAMPAVEHPVPQTVDLPVRDDELAHILRAFYADDPGLVFHVLTALRAADPDGHRWLAGVLDDRPELADLARHVRVGGGGTDTTRTPDRGGEAETPTTRE